MNEGPFEHDFHENIKANHLFKPASWLSKIDFIHHLILFNNVLMVVLAEKGAGKSSFLSLLQLSLENDFPSVIIKAPASRKAGGIEEEIAEAFSLQQGSMHSIVAQVNEKKTHAVLMLDDAQYLDADWMAEVLTAIKQQGNHGYFHLCLAADYSIVASLNCLVNKEFNNLIHTIELGGLNENETKTYVLHRAQMEGLDESLLSKDVLQKIYKASGGDFAKINVNLKQYFHYAQARPESKSKLIPTAAAACAALAILGITYSLVNEAYLPEAFKSKLVKSAPAEQIARTETLMRHETLQQASLSSAVPYWRDFAHLQLPKPAVPLQSLINSIEEQEFSPKYAVLDKVVYIPQIRKDEKRSQKAGLKDYTRMTSKTEGEKSRPAKTGTVVAHSILHAKTAKERQMERYTIQLVAGHSKSTMKHFMEEHHLLKKAKIYQASNNNTHWYVLTIGEYDSLNQAKGHIHQLPHALSKFNPWVRPISGLKNLG